MNIIIGIVLANLADLDRKSLNIISIVLCNIFFLRGFPEAEEGIFTPKNRNMYV